GERGLRDIAALGRASEVQRLAQRKEIPDLVKLHVAPSAQSETPRNETIGSGATVTHEVGEFRIFPTEAAHSSSRLPACLREGRLTYRQCGYTLRRSQQ